MIFRNKNTKISEELSKKLSIAAKNRKNPSNWKGGYTKRNKVSFDQHEGLLKPFHDIRRNQEDYNILEVKCTYCGKWYIPTYIDIKNRLKGIYYKGNGGRNLYCSEECKQECPTYSQIKYPKGFKPSTSREVQPELRKLVFERDNWSCVKCGIGENLHCHHIDPVINNPIESADINNCMTVCKNCHKEIHKKEGCKYNELKC
jgi:5-methylcytosine-specific restriction enzyme A